MLLIETSPTAADIFSIPEAGIERQYREGGTNAKA
jgi:hypothetical protein